MFKMKKICFVATIHKTLKGFVLGFAEYLHTYSDWEITFVCNPNEEFQNSLPEYIRFFPISMKRGISCGGISAVISLKELFKTEKFDLVQYCTPNASCYASIAAKMANVPIRLYCQWGLVFEGFSGIKRKLFMIEEKMVCGLSTWIEPDSFGNLEYCRRLGFYDEKKSSVVLYGSAKGVNLEVFDIKRKDSYRRTKRQQYCIADDSFVFGFVGSLTGDKGTNELLTAFREIVKSCKNCYLLLVGNTEKENSLDSELMQWAKGNNKVIFSGPSKTVPQEMAAMDCYVTPSYREGFGITVIEAGAMGLPVITTNIPGPTDVIRDGFNGLVVEKKDSKQLLKAMKKIYRNPNLGKEMGNNGLRVVQERYDQKLVFQAMYEDRMRLLEGK